MKTELKTLKDLEIEQLSVYKEMGEMHARSYIRVAYKRARQEAIKWIKRLEDWQEYYQKQLKKKVGYSYQLESQVWWIKHFFNLTEKDLK